ncbi:MAG: hypothetical protein ABWX94_00390 [Candidatus Saccharimonadales bacterium]
MKKSFVIWLSAAGAGALLILLLNTTPLARIGLSLELPGGWVQPTAPRVNSSCKSRQAEGIPFAFKRSNKTQTCKFDTNKLGLVLNIAIGVAIGGVATAITAKGFEKREK